MASLLLALTAAVPVWADCNININIDPSNGAGIYLYDETAGSYVLQGATVDPYNGPLVCGNDYTVWVEIDGHTFEVKNAHGWSINPAGDEASGTATKQTQNIHFNGDVIIENNPPVAVLGDYEVCEGESVTLDGSSSYDPDSNDDLEYRWDLDGNGSFDTGWSSSPTHTFTPASTVTVTLEVRDVYLDIVIGTSDTDTGVVTVDPCCDPPVIVSHPSSSTVCEGGSAVFAVSATGTEPLSYQWKKNGSPISGETGTSLTIDPVSASDTGSYTVTVTNDCGEVTSNAAVLTVQVEPTAAAGSDLTICDNASAYLSGSATDYASVLWTTSGDGSFGSASSLSTDYTPGSGDIAAGSVTLTLTAQPVSPCGTPASDPLTVTIQASPTAVAGSDVTICDTESAPLSGTATDYASVLWTTSGDGSFGSASSLSTDYTPGSGDIAAGSVTLTLRVQAVSPCGTPASDPLTVTIQASPTAAAGSDITICDTESASLSGSATDYSSVLWSTGGDGSFGNVSALATDYTPGSGDIAAGSATLTLTAQPISPCGTEASDPLTVTIQASPTAAAGSDVTICDTESAPLSGSATGYSSVLWSTSGDGSFANASELSTSYTPGAGDIAAGSVTLTLTAQPVSPCGTAASDQLTASIQASPTSAAGVDVTICDTESAPLSGTATGYSSVSWSTSGDGSFANASALSTDYTPGSGDIADGSVTLTLTAQPISPCGTEASDPLTVTIQASPTVAAGSNVTICDTAMAFLSGSASGHSTVLWTTSGDGSFGNAASLATGYTPGSGDIADGSAILTLTAQPISPCSTPASDAMGVTIQASPTATAGGDITICDTDPATLSGSASGHSSVQWTTSGDGSFGNAGSLSTDYTPGDDDIDAGSVTLTLTAQPLSPCGTAASDPLTVTVEVCNDPPDAQNRRLQTCAIGTGEVPEDEWITFDVVVNDPEINPFLPVGSPDFHEIVFPADELTVRFGSVWGDLTAVEYGPGSTARVELTYVPPPGFIGEDVVTFMAVDPFGEWSTGTVTIEVRDCREGGGGTAEGIVINEVAWAGTKHSVEHEWIELHNTKYGAGETAIDLDGWVLAWRHRRSEGMQPEVIRNLNEFRALTPDDERWEVELEGEIEPGDFYLLERFVEDVVSDIDAELVYAEMTPYDPNVFRLSDLLGEEIYLFDAEGDRVNSANTDYSKRPPGGAPWPAGPGTGIVPPFASMERLEFGEDEIDFDEHWDTNQGIIVFGLDASLEFLTATADHMNEALVIKRLREEPLDWLTVRQGDPVMLSFAMRDEEEAIADPPWVTLFAADPVMGGGGQLDPSEFVNIQRVFESRGFVPNYVIELDTSLLPVGSYELFVTLGQGVFHAVGIRVI